MLRALSHFQRMTASPASGFRQRFDVVWKSINLYDEKVMQNIWEFWKCWSYMRLACAAAVRIVFPWLASSWTGTSPQTCMHKGPHFFFFSCGRFVTWNRYSLISGYCVLLQGDSKKGTDLLGCILTPSRQSRRLA